MKPVRFCSLFICHEQPNKHFVVCIGWVSSTSTYECATAVAKLASRRTWTMMMALGAVPSTFCVLVIWCVFWSSHFHQRRMVAWRWVGRWAWVWHRTEVKWSPCVRTIGVVYVLLDPAWAWLMAYGSSNLFGCHWWRQRESPSRTMMERGEEAKAPMASVPCGRAGGRASGSVGRPGQAPMAFLAHSLHVPAGSWVLATT